MKSKHVGCINLLQVTSSVIKKGEHKKTESDSDSDSHSSTKSFTIEKTTSKRKQKLVESSLKVPGGKPKASRLIFL